MGVARTTPPLLLRKTASAPGGEKGDDRGRLTATRMGLRDTNFENNSTRDVKVLMDTSMS